MANFHNCTDKFLWNKGILPILKWLYIGFFGYVLVMILHKPIVNIKNTTITLSWAVFTLLLLYIWKKNFYKTADLIQNWTMGYVGEWYVKRELIKLPEDFHVLYDVRINGLKGNIDFVVVNKNDVYAVEVKTNKWFSWKNRKQARRQAGELQKRLKELEVTYVTPILIYANRKAVKQPADEHVFVMGRKEVIKAFTQTIPLRRNCDYDYKKINKIVHYFKQ